MVVCGGLLTRLASENHHKPPPKRRKYAGFGTVDIPAIRKSIVLHIQGLATLKEPNYLLLSQILAVVCLLSTVSVTVFTTVKRGEIDGI